MAWAAATLVIAARVTRIIAALEAGRAWNTLAAHVVDRIVGSTIAVVVLRGTTISGVRSHRPGAFAKVTGCVAWPRHASLLARAASPITIETGVCLACSGRTDRTPANVIASVVRAAIAVVVLRRAAVSSAGIYRAHAFARERPTYASLDPPLASPDVRAARCRFAIVAGAALVGDAVAVGVVTRHARVLRAGPDIPLALAPVGRERQRVEETSLAAGTALASSVEAGVLVAGLDGVRHADADVVGEVVWLPVAVVVELRPAVTGRRDANYGGWACVLERGARHRVRFTREALAAGRGNVFRPIQAAHGRGVFAHRWAIGDGLRVRFDSNGLLRIGGGAAGIGRLQSFAKRP